MSADPIDWQAELDRLTALLVADKDAEGWPLSPERKADLRHDIAECKRAIRRTHRLNVRTTDKGYEASCACRCPMQPPGQQEERRMPTEQTYPFPITYAERIILQLCIADVYRIQPRDTEAPTLADRLFYRLDELGLPSDERNTQ